ncbi:hypothetical protein [Kitasatospora sp. NPDC085879]|uniref:hypothetical protein n=1 Tax=Kitasatospora sp. NPDC085879 TaxID=3154769 RepID=UPI00343E1512
MGKIVAKAMTQVSADQIRALVACASPAGHRRNGDPEHLVVPDTGHDVTRLPFVLADLPGNLAGRI